MIKRHLPYAGLLHEVVEHNDTLYLAGIVADDLMQDMAGQARDCLAQLDRLLTLHGSDRRHILQAIIYLAGLSAKLDFDNVWKAWLDPAHLPARAGIGVGDLGSHVLVEIIVIAAKIQDAAVPRGRTKARKG